MAKEAADAIPGDGAPRAAADEPWPRNGQTALGSRS
jgi:hypothetical protein